MSGTREKWYSLVLVELTFEWYERAMVFRIYGILYFYFLFRSTVKKNTWMRAISVTVMVIILKLQF